VGLKPSAGLVRRSGGLPEIFLDFEVAGGLGRTVDDVARLLRVLCAADLSATAPSHARILFMPRFGAHPIDPDIAHSVNQAAVGLATLGHHVELAPSLDAFESINEVWPDLSRAGLAWMDASTPLDLTLCGKVAQDALAGGRAMTAADMFEVMHRVQTLGQQLKACFARCDFIMTPATAALPWPVGQDHPHEIDGKAAGPRGHAVFTAFANAAGLPAIALPTGLPNGLPTGMQLVGPKGSDAALLALSRQYEAAYPWSDRWPPLAAHQGAAA
jgi:aspartyl-tRNA(Asn)/glutamyl-tRNA(Gln) amidotransferase subunit A